VRVHEGMVEIRLTEVHSTLTTNSDAPRSRV
jgi:hypothetical protein